MALIPTLILACLVALASPSTIGQFNDQQDEPLKPIRLAYGSDSLQFGDLRLPHGPGPFPTIMIIHGGCWLSQYDYTLMDSMAADLTNRGYATWNVEYRRTEDPGGAWPGTFLDVAQALKYLAEISNDYPVDPERLIITGHSAGGHLALWLGIAKNVLSESEIHVSGLPEIAGIVSLAGIVDLEAYVAPGGCGSNTKNLMGGTPEEVPERYREGSPITNLPAGISQILITGDADNIVPISHVQPYFEAAQKAGDDVEMVNVTGAGHFAVITPGSVAWDAIVLAFGRVGLVD